MTRRELYNRVMDFEDPGGIFLWGMGIRGATLDRWLAEGLPPEADPLEFVGVDRVVNYEFDTMPLPRFEVRTLDETDRHRVWIDELGARRLDFKEDREPGFVTRSWLRFPVETREDFEAMKSRFDPGDEARYRALTEAEVDGYRGSELPVFGVIRGLFWNARDWMGFENLCMAFLDRPGLAHEIMEFYAGFLLAGVERAYGGFEVDAVILMEDMAFKGRPMISAAMMREFMSPHYRRLGSALKSRGVRRVYIDCDGDCSLLIDEWLDAGLDGIYPTEIAAGMDPVALRRRYPDRLCITGGVDKRAVAAGPDAIVRELRPKLELLAPAGGYTPGIDHAAPPDISLDNYRRFVDEVRGIEREIFG